MRRLLIIGCGDVALRLVKLLRGRYRVYALNHSPHRTETLRAHGIVPLAGDLDDAANLARLAGLPHDVVHFAPPPTEGTRDPRTGNLIQALKRSASIPQRLIYISTSGVYGDCAGEVVAEHRTPRPQSDRGWRRMAAEQLLRHYGRESGVRVVILRVPGIYAADRLPVERIRAGTPALMSSEDSYSNHIHADDLARIVLAALSRGRAGRTYHASDEAWLKMGDYFDLVAQYTGMAKPPRISRAEAERALPPRLFSFMRESRRLSNRRLRTELRVRLKYPSVEQALRAAVAQLPAGARSTNLPDSSAHA